jgi:hypothetical protein
MLKLINIRGYNNIKKKNENPEAWIIVVVSWMSLIKILTIESIIKVNNGLYVTLKKLFA